MAVSLVYLSILEAEPINIQQVISWSIPTCILRISMPATLSQAAFLVIYRCTGGTLHLPVFQ